MKNPEKARWYQRRCKARTLQGTYKIYYDRCELPEHGSDEPHVVFSPNCRWIWFDPEFVFVDKERNFVGPI